MTIADRQSVEQEIVRLRNVCAQAYQLAGCVGAPERVLEILSAAADGRPLPHGGEFLPITAEDCDAVHELRSRLVRRIHEVYQDGEVIEPDHLRRAANEVRQFDGPLGTRLLTCADTPASVGDVMQRVAEFDREWRRGRA
jgi:hypothetical protein